ncbi:hypothetical protein [Trinickia sp. EG282A]|uniref:hypothetical protein n=1 Tax=Trinickia sp. EG282A TaxID=3237013 RepID=UPI0034D37B0A
MPESSTLNEPSARTFEVRGISGSTFTEAPASNARAAAGVSSTLNESQQLIRHDSCCCSGQSVDAKRYDARAARFTDYHSALASRQMPNHEKIGCTQRTDHGHARAYQCPIPKRTDVIAAIDHRCAMRNGRPRPFDAFIERRIDDGDDRASGY